MSANIFIAILACLSKYARHHSHTVSVTRIAKMNPHARNF